MKILVGLGNPGAKYAKNRHNIGFMALDEVASHFGFSPWRSKFQGQISEGKIGTEKVLLLKPETFMNLSGQSAGEAMRFYKSDPQDIWVFHDELDLAPGKVKVKRGGGHAGHNGLRSCHQHLSQDYGRIRLGIGHPGHKDRVSAYVLSDFSKADQDWLAPLLQALPKGLPALTKDDTGGFTTQLAAALHGPAGEKGQRKKSVASTHSAKPDTPEEKPLSAMEKLVQHFRS